MSLNSCGRVLAPLLFSLLLVHSTRAELIGGVDFPLGSLSFADVVVDYQPDVGAAVPDAANSEPSNALGVPEVPGNTSIGACTGDPFSCPFVSLGDGGSIVLRFNDNALIADGTPDLDLWIFEVGSDVERTVVEISEDGISWVPAGSVEGTTSGIDLDAEGVSVGIPYFFVRLTDDPNEGGQSGSSVGADIDAVGAIAAIPFSVPLHWVSTLLLGIILTLVAFRLPRKSNGGLQR